MCSLCESDENLKEALNEKGEQIVLCEACRTCEGCDNEVDEDTIKSKIKSTNSKIFKLRIKRLNNYLTNKVKSMTFLESKKRPNDHQ